MMENMYNDDDRQYLQMMQENINRMSCNSSNCKAWLITIVAAMLAVGCNITDLHWWLLLTIAPILIFWYLDSFYLSLERGMRNRQREFLNKAREYYAHSVETDEMKRKKLLKRLFIISRLKWMKIMICPKVLFPLWIENSQSQFCQFMELC